MKYELNVDGEAYEFDDSKLSVDESLIIKEQAGQGVIQWGRGLSDGDPHSLMALVFLAKKRSGEAVKWNDLKSLDMMALTMQVLASLDKAIRSLGIDDEDDEPESDPTEEAPTPTPPAKKTPAKKTRGQTPKLESTDT